MDFLIGSGPIGSDTNGTDWVWFGLVQPLKDSICLVLIGYQTRPHPIRSDRSGVLISIIYQSHLSQPSPHSHVSVSYLVLRNLRSQKPISHYAHSGDYSVHSLLYERKEVFPDGRFY